MSLKRMHFERRIKYKKNQTKPFIQNLLYTESKLKAVNRKVETFIRGT